MHGETKRTAIPPAVKAAVAERDSIDGWCCCIVCGSPNAAPNAHIVRRSHGGMGVEQNIVSLCPRCHRAFDEGEGIKTLLPLGFRNREDIAEYIIEYIKQFYPGWTEAGVTYRRKKHA